MSFGEYYYYCYYYSHYHYHYNYYYYNYSHYYYICSSDRSANDAKELNAVGDTPELPST